MSGDGKQRKAFVFSCVKCGAGYAAYWAAGISAITQREAVEQVRGKGWAIRGKLWHCGECK